ncbi:TonB-dependent receptor domain-containing protein [Sorangium sp. So ce1153]|uniref:TonB-dependent receptor domain-containing protein n=1 Tax=Sorangium sp. So ce1153 TaxID=3133333 RepID=UPI003F5D6F81
MPSTASSVMRLIVSEALLLAVALTGGAARAQPAGAPPPEPPPSGGDGDTGGISVPRGGAGAVVVPQPGTAQPAPAAAAEPKLIKYAPPAYPEEAQRAGVQGSVILKLDIDKTGRVTKVEVATPGGHGFDEAALAAAPGLEFEPARRPDGTPAAVRILYRYSFTLTPKPAEAAAPAPPADVETVVGTVMAAGTGEPLPDVAVSLLRPDGGREEAKTDQGGKFRFKNLPPGKYRVEVAAPGFEPFAADEEIAAGEAIDVRYRISLAAPKDGKAPAGIEVTVQGERPPREVTRRTLERREIDRIPGTGGDALRSLQSLPGVARSGFGLLIVRGSAPEDTLTFIDRTPVPIIYHFGGLSSVVPTEMLEKIDFYPGNFSAVYGRAMGGIVDVGLRSPKQDGKYHGVVQLDLIDGRLLLEGPVPGLEDWTFIAAGRRSWVDAWLGPVLKETGSSVTQAPVYYDYQFVLEGHPSTSERVRASFYGSDDAFKITLDKPPEEEPALTGDLGLHTAFQRLQLSYENRLGSRDRLLWSLALGRDVFDFQVPPLAFNVTTKSLDLRLELSHRFARYLTMNVGTDLSGGIATVNLRAPSQNPAGHPSNQPFSLAPFQDRSFDGAYSRPAAYAEFEVVPSSRARIVPGVRVDYALDTQTLDVSPRINGRYDIKSGFPRTTAKGGVGLYHQAPQFQETIEPFGTAGLKSNRAIHYGLGVEQELTPQLDVTVDGFYKALDRLVVFSPEKEGYANDGTGYAVGGELLLKYKPDERFFGWAAYTLSRSVRTDGPGEEEHLTPYDQTHVLTVLGSLRLGRGWELGARFRLVSGNLQTPYVCNPEEKGCNPNRVNAIYHASSARYSPIPLGGDYSERMPLFHQLDIRADKTWKFKNWQLGLYLDIQNVYNHAAAEGISYNFNYTKREYVTGLPFLPTLGLRGDF